MRPSLRSALRRAPSWSDLNSKLVMRGRLRICCSDFRENCLLEEDIKDIAEDCLKKAPNWSEDAILIRIFHVADEAL